MNEDMLVRQARAVLDFNWTGEYTMPGPRLYPHQWSWDAAFIAIGYSHYDQERATRGLRHLFEAQWKNGLLPQLVFNPHFTNYFPGPNFWHAKESPDAPEHHETSGVVQPPIHATAALYIYRHAEDEAKARAFLEYAFSKLSAWHDYLYRERDPEGEGLVYIRHPWESGMDNSPVWDQTMQRLHLGSDQVPRYRRADIHTVSASDRPTSGAYDRFAYLVEFFADRAYDETKIRQDCPFLIQDVLFNSLLHKADKDLAEISRIVGEDPAPTRNWPGRQRAPSRRSCGMRTVGYTWTTISSVACLYPHTSGRTSLARCTPELRSRIGQSAWSTPSRTKGSAWRTRPLHPFPATIYTASGSPKRDTGGVRSGST